MTLIEPAFLGLILAVVWGTKMLLEWRGYSALHAWILSVLIWGGVWFAVAHLSRIGSRRRTYHAILRYRRLRQQRDSEQP